MTLKSRLYALILTSIILRVIVFFMLPNTPSVIAPDEGTYGRAANWTALGKPATEFPDYGAGLYASGRSLLLPAAFLNKIGFSPLDSVRLTSSLYGLLTLCLATAVILMTASKNTNFAHFAKRNPRVLITLFLTFAFLPSHFVWSNLGLRESATGFWVVSVFAFLFLLLQLNKRVSLLTITGFLISIVMVFSARPQVGWVLGISLLLYLVAKIRDNLGRALILATLIGITLGYAATVSTVYELETTFSATNLTSNSMDGFNTNISCKFDAEVVQVNNDKYFCISKTKKVYSRDLKNPGKAFLEQIGAIPYHHEVNKLGAASVIETQFCPNRGVSQFDKYFCIGYRAPYTTFTFLFRPILGADITSSASLFAAVENVFWFSAILFIVIMFIRNRRLAFFGALAPSLLFFSIYSVAAGAYEGNMGTAFRHKSLILWVVILLVASTIVATQQRKAEREGVSASSQE